ncbi:MAG: hypothetical protein H6610_11940 [Ignavibacteriales bacterium]|nr:hypothetical protein [Ignavibacteriales bacterium]
MNKNRIALSLAVLFMLFTLTSCAPEGYSSHEYGFFGGIWHGFIFFFSLIGKLFGADIGLYAEHNTGFFYWLGFIIGIGGLGGGAAASR